MNRWLARFSFSFLIVAAVLGWTAYNGLRTNTISTPRVAVYILSGGMAVALGFVGIRERHKRR